MKRGRVYCERWDKCHKLEVCLCEVDPEDNNPPPVKRKRAAKLPWPERRQQILEFAREHKSITTTTLMRKTNATHSAASKWIRDLVKEGGLKCQTPATSKRYHHQPAVYTTVPHSNSAPPALPVS